jgi:hypothetical protein
MEGKRPGGLTALAILNFIFSTCGFVNAVGLFAGSALLKLAASSPGTTTQDADELAKFRLILDNPFIKVLGVFAIVNCLLLLVSGVGYIQQKKVMGRMLGSIYGVLGLIVATAVMIVMRDVPGAVGIQSVLGFVYPVLTLVLLNTVFKQDFYR